LAVRFDERHEPRVRLNVALAVGIGMDTGECSDDLGGHWGPRKFRNLLPSIKISANKLVGALTQRQRELVADQIERRSA
jgi:hypothetical protein